MLWLNGHHYPHIEHCIDTTLFINPSLVCCLLICPLICPENSAVIVYTARTLTPYGAWQKGIFVLCPFNLEHTTAGSEGVRLDPIWGFQPYSKVTGKSYGNLFLFLVFIIFDLHPLGTLCNCVLYCL